MNTQRLTYTQNDFEAIDFPSTQGNPNSTIVPSISSHKACRQEILRFIRGEFGFNARQIEDRLLPVITSEKPSLKMVRRSKESLLNVLSRIVELPLEKQTVGELLINQWLTAVEKCSDFAFQGTQLRNWFETNGITGFFEFLQNVGGTKQVGGNHLPLEGVDSPVCEGEAILEETTISIEMIEPDENDDVLPTMSELSVLPGPHCSIADEGKSKVETLFNGTPVLLGQFLLCAELAGQTDFDSFLVQSLTDLFGIKLCAWHERYLESPDPQHQVICQRIEQVLGY